MEPFFDQALISCILLTIKIAALATLISFIIGVGLAWLMGRWGFGGKRWVAALCTLPLVLPPTVVGYGLILLLGRRGLLGPWLAEHGINLIFSWPGAVVAATVVIFPLSYRSAAAALESVDHNLENAARTLGASEWRILWRVSLPLAYRNIFAGQSLAFARGLGEFGATLMIAGNLPGKTQTLALAIYDSFQAGNDSKALGLVLLTAALAAGLLLLAELISGPKPRRRP